MDDRKADVRVSSVLAVDIGDTTTRIAVGGPGSPTVRTEAFPSAVRLDGTDTADGAVVSRPRTTLGRSTVEVAGRSVTPAELVGMVIGEALERYRGATSAEETPDLTVLTFPAHWSEAAVQAFRDAALYAGIEDGSLVTVAAPVAVATRETPVAASGETCLVVCTGGVTSDVCLLRFHDGQWSVEQKVDAPGTDSPAGIGEIVSRAVRILPTTPSRILVAGDTADMVAGPLQEAVLDRPDAGGVAVVDDPSFAVARRALAWALTWAQDASAATAPGNARRRRTVIAAGAVAAVVAVAAGAAVVVNQNSGTPTSGDSVAAYSPDIPGERFAAFIGEDGQFDCMALYDRVPARVLADAKLGIEEVTASRETAENDSSGSCWAGYVGDELGPVHQEIDGWDKSDAVPLMMSVIEQDDPDAAPVEEEALAEEHGIVAYRDWELVTFGADEPGVALGLRTAVTAIDEHSILMLALSLDEVEERQERHDDTYDVDAALKQVIDGLEDSNRAPVAPGNPPVIDDQTEFTCSALYDRASAQYLHDQGIVVGDFGHKILDRSGAEQRVTVPLTDNTGREQCFVSTPDTVSGVSTVMSTGASDDIPGHPVVGVDELEGWEEYWAFSPVIAPPTANLEGVQTYNLRYCQPGADHCITLSTNENYTASNLRSTPAELKAQTVPIARALTGHTEQPEP